MLVCTLSHPTEFTHFTLLRKEEDKESRIHSHQPEKAEASQARAAWRFVGAALSGLDHGLFAGPGRETASGERSAFAFPTCRRRAQQT